MEKKAMGREDLVAKMAEITGGTKKDARLHLEAMIEGVKALIVEGNDVALNGFGTFSISEVEASVKRNPKTGENVSVDAHKKVSFKLSDIFKKLFR